MPNFFLRTPLKGCFWLQEYSNAYECTLLNQKWNCYFYYGFDVKQEKCYLQFQKFVRVSVGKKENFLYGLETLNYYAPQLWTFFVKELSKETQ